MDDRGGCATGPYRTPTILGHDIKTEESEQLYLIHRNKHREAAKMKRQRHVAQMKEWINTPLKRTKQNGDKQSIRCRVKTLVIRMLKELSEDLKHKKNQSKMKGTLIETKNNLQGNNRRLEEAENQINDLEQKEAKKKKTKKHPINQNN